MISVEEIEERIGVQFPDYAKKRLEKNKDKWHCSDNPLHVVCDCWEIADLFNNTVRDIPTKEFLHVSIK